MVRKSFVLHRLHQLVCEVQQEFDRFAFQKFYQLLQNFCTVLMSNLYFDVVKDRLYTHGKNSKSRRSAQTVLEHVLQVLVRLLVPVTPLSCPGEYLVNGTYSWCPRYIGKPNASRTLQ